MPLAGLACSEVGFGLYFAREQPAILHGRSDSVAQMPSSPVIHPEMPLDLFRRDAFLGLADQRRASCYSTTQNRPMSTNSTTTITAAAVTNFLLPCSMWGIFRYLKSISST